MRDMMTFKHKLLSVAGFSTLMSLLISSGMVQAIPLCYMVNQTGQTLDLSYMCNPTVETNQTLNNQQEERTFSRRVPVTNQTTQDHFRTYTDVYKYVNSNDNQGDSWNDFQYYNRFLEFPSTMTGRTAIRQEISPRIIRSEAVNFYNADSSFNQRRFTTRRPEDLRNVSSQYVLNGQGVLELRYYNLSE
ncbi:hypothetical protein cce_2575 [Crocosphaera subtropica ATCC 51142]|uniref:Uncharacterized protein n=2 Tax=Crocosphaera TaxID=263510 RepID=B1WSD7_CROS5|nr:hypothetical protein cce_2575 [Crocosphaera subtropica ATCC 51142]